MPKKAGWAPTKYEISADGLRGSRDPAELWVASRRITDLVAKFYERAIRDHARGHLLDLGCGKAPLYGYYEDLVDDATLVDWAESLHANPFLDHVHDLSEPLPLPAEAFGVVLLSDVLEHMRRPERLLAEIARVLAPGGNLIMNVPFFVGIHEEPHDYFRYTRFALESLATEAGLTVRELKPLGGWVDVMIDLTGRMLSNLPVVGTGLTGAFHRLMARVGSKANGFNARTGEFWPLGYTMIATKAAA